MTDYILEATPGIEPEFTVLQTSGEVLPPTIPRKYWTRKGIAEWLVEQLDKRAAKLVAWKTPSNFRLRHFARLKPR